MTTLMHHCAYSDCGNQYLRKGQYSTFISVLPFTLPDKTQTLGNHAKYILTYYKSITFIAFPALTIKSFESNM